MFKSVRGNPEARTRIFRSREASNGVELLPQRLKRKDFCTVSCLTMKSGYTTIIHSVENPTQAASLQDVIYYELLKLNESNRKRKTAVERHDKVILLHVKNLASCCKISENLPGNSSMGCSTAPSVFTISVRCHMVWLSRYHSEDTKEQTYETLSDMFFFLIF